MTLDVLPQRIFLRQAIASREQLVRSFADYFSRKHYIQGSEYIRKFVDHCISHRIPERDVPRFLLGTLFNNVSNTIPSAFWIVYRVFSDSTLLEMCRAEVKGACSDTVSPDGLDIITLDLAYLLSSCPVLRSTYHEVLRFYGIANSIRMVAEDCALDNFVLKKGGIVMIPARVQHNNPNIWGENVGDFNYTRFLRDHASSEKRINPMAFRAFGGGTILCPGRHFATSEILLFVSLLILRFDLRPRAGNWMHPSTKNSSQTEAILQPDEDVEILTMPRPATRGKSWRIAFSGRRDVDVQGENIGSH